MDNFASFEYPRKIYTHNPLPIFSRLAVYKARKLNAPAGSGWMRSAPMPVSVKNNWFAFYMDSDFMPGLRWENCDHLARGIKHTGWYTDNEGVGELCRGVVFTLPSGRGYLAGWTLGDGMLSGVECKIVPDLRDAALTADEHARVQAEKMRESNYCEQEDV